MVGLIGYAIAVIISPLEYELSVITWDAGLYALFVLLGFFGGCYAVAGFDTKPAHEGPRPVTIPVDTPINVVAMIAALCIGARIVDRFILRNFVLGQTFMESRESLNENVSVFGYIGASGFCLGVVALLLLWLSSSTKRRPGMTLFVCLLTAYPPVEALLQGSRSTVLHIAFLVFFFARSSNAIPWLVRSRWALAGLGIGMVALFEVVFELRTLQGQDELDMADIFTVATIGQFARPPQWLLEGIISTGGQGVVGSLLKVWTHSFQYLTHSWIVYFVNFESFDGVLGWGRVHLYLPTRVFSSLIQEDLNYDPTLYGMQQGISGTAISLIYYDFGALGPILAAVFGALATMVHQKALSYPERWLPLHTYLGFACLLMPVDNQLVGALGYFATWAFILYIPFHYILGVLLGGGESKAGAPSQEIAQARREATI